jgi:hypothetical protein
LPPIPQPGQITEYFGTYAVSPPVVREWPPAAPWGDDDGNENGDGLADTGASLGTWVVMLAGLTAVVTGGLRGSAG